MGRWRRQSARKGEPIDRRGHHRSRPADTGSKADLCFTDSPYNVDYAGGVEAGKGKCRRILLPSERLGPHIVGDVREVLHDGWDPLIAHPPCSLPRQQRPKHLHRGCRRENGADGAA